MGKRHKENVLSISRSDSILLLTAKNYRVRQNRSYSNRYFHKTRRKNADNNQFKSVMIWESIKKKSKSISGC
jgi:hypothetical protein